MGMPRRLRLLKQTLLDARNPDGGWGGRAGSASLTETTALCCLALRAEASAVPAEAADAHTRMAGEGAAHWLRDAQRADGGWPAQKAVEESGWSTALAVLALAGSDARGDRSAALAGARWLLASRSRSLPWLHRVRRRIRREEEPVELDPDLTGWPWSPRTFGWVEPTAYSLLALRRLRGELPSEPTRERIALGERMILDRACIGGGWNYGNRVVLGERLWPYPDTTALALLALAGGPASEEVEAGFRWLETALETVRSGLSLSLGVLALETWGRRVEPYRDRLMERFEHTGFRGEVRSLAWAAWACAGGGKQLRGWLDA